ncbi:hypothetical protein, partial [Enterobacter roggenkampii]|uniref:hypothetical protein n=1 Tax=Enterobacter roggenkampii TaxID=1812935 RepID=UPI00197ADDBC
MYFRARVSTYGSGTVTVVGTLSKVSVSHLGNIFIGGGQVSEGVLASLGGNPLAIALEARTTNKT